MATTFLVIFPLPLPFAQVIDRFFTIGEAIGAGVAWVVISGAGVGALSL
jgi:hypothetical protein